MPNSSKYTDIKTLLMRGVLCRCPQCGKGRVLKGYLTKVDACSVCDSRFNDLNADDGPAWFTMFFVGLLTVPVLIFLAVHNSFSIVVSSFIVFAFITLLTLVLLPVIKGVFIAVLWYLRERDR